MAATRSRRSPSIAGRRAGADGSAGVAYADGNLMPIGEATVSVLDWGFSRSDVTYDVVHVWKGSFFRLDDHLDRFARSCEGLRLNPGLDRNEIRDVLMACVRESRLQDAYVEMLCTRWKSVSIFFRCSRLHSLLPSVCFQERE